MIQFRETDPRASTADGAGYGRTLADLQPGESAEVAGIGGGDDVRVRLMELGFLPGGRVRLVRRAPLGCPLEVDLDGVRWSLRLETARGVHLLPVV
jgi:Fe2+ transport system protein FeoA